MTEDLKPFLDEAFSKTPDVFYIDSFVREIVDLPTPMPKEYRDGLAFNRVRESREYLFERCDYFSDSGICIKHELDSRSTINVAVINPEKTLYIFKYLDTFLDLIEYERGNRSLSINTSRVSHFTSEIGDSGSKVFTIYLTDKII